MMRKMLTMLWVMSCLGLLAGEAPLLAREPVGSPPSTFSTIGIIRAKDKHNVSFVRGDHFVTSYMTRVIIEDKPFRLVSLPVPCKAEIHYVVNKKTGAWMATVIKVLEIPKGAKSGWARPAPE